MSLEHAAIAANRFGFGARPGELARIAADPRGWIKAQLVPERATPAPIAALPAGEDDLLAFGRYRLARRAAAARGSPVLAEEDAFREAFQERLIRAIEARLQAAIASEAPARERLTHFWSNHFTVSGAKPVAIALPPAFEREAIRPHVCGRFEDMLLAASRHPGMLIYLDNHVSIGPNSAWAKRPRGAPRIPGFGRPSGLNENLAREILELHALGVDGGYVQDDVVALAKILTGWRVQVPDRAAIMDGAAASRPASDLFTFEPDAHEPGPHTLLGVSYPEDGEAQGRAALRDLAARPQTARFLATKLVRHYVADDPPPAAVERVAKAFCDSSGDLASTVAALVDAPETWAAPAPKFKRPEEYLISCLRALDAPAAPRGSLAASVMAMGQRVYGAPGPDGWADLAGAWLSSDLLWKRIEWADALGERVARADVAPAALGRSALGPLLSEETVLAVERAESPAQGLALLFASPEFNRR